MNLDEDDFSLDIEPLGVIDTEKQAAWDFAIQEEIRNRKYLLPSFDININRQEEKIKYTSQFDNCISTAVARQLKETYNIEPKKVCLILNSTVTYISLCFDFNGKEKSYAYRCSEKLPWFFGQDYLDTINWEFRMEFCTVAKGAQLQELLRFK